MAREYQIRGCYGLQSLTTKKERRDSMLNDKKIIGFIPSKDPKKARTFFEKVLELRFVADDKFALVFDANGTMLRVVTVKDFEPFSVHAARMGSVRYREGGGRPPEKRSEVRKIQLHGARHAGNLDSPRRRQGRVVQRS